VRIYTVLGLKLFIPMVVRLLFSKKFFAETSIPIANPIANCINFHPFPRKACIYRWWWESDSNA
jgi:hypothetical protein